jgi:large subunit ribosomal protein L31
VGFDRFLIKTEEILCERASGDAVPSLSTELFTDFVDKPGRGPNAPRGLCSAHEGSILSRPFGAAIMKPEIHPNYAAIKVVCSCGNEFTTRSTLGQDLHVEVCSSCHPFYTGRQKIVDSGGRVDKFRRRYSKSAAN